MKHAIFAGSFDPFTNGHLWTLTQGTALFDRVTVAVGVNHGKRDQRTIAEREEVVRQIVSRFAHVDVDRVSGEFLAAFARRKGAQYLLRGIRRSDEFPYEQRMAHLNRERAPDLTVVHLIAPAHLAHVSSSLVRGIVGLEGWETVVQTMVPQETFRYLQEHYHDTH